MCNKLCWPAASGPAAWHPVGWPWGDGGSGSGRGVAVARTSAVGDGVVMSQCQRLSEP